MRALLIILVLFSAPSCCSVYMVPELNTCGVIVRKKKCRMESGDKIYRVKITKGVFIKHPTNKSHQIGDTICFKSTVYNF